MTVLLIVGGLVGLFVGGEVLVRGAVGLATRLGVSPLVIGLTVVGFGTSSPELVTSIDAALVGAPGIAIGNVVGSNIANILLILGIAALFSPVEVRRADFRRDGPVLVIAMLACAAVVVAGTVTRPVGAVFVAALVAYLARTYLVSRRTWRAEAVGRPLSRSGLFRAVAGVAVGIVIVVGGAHLLVTGAIDLARQSGLSEAAIGLTIVAVGTSLPEFAASVAAARRGQNDVAFGNIVGSSIFNVFAILGITALVKPIPVPVEIARFDVWVMLAATAALVIVSVTRWRVSRPEGALLVGAYVVFLLVVLAGISAA